MARKIEHGGFLVIECTARELTFAVGTCFAICDFCGEPKEASSVGYYVAVLNQWLCGKCYDEWIQRAHWYPEDADVQRRNFDFYAPRLGIKC